MDDRPILSYNPCPVIMDHPETAKDLVHAIEQAETLEAQARYRADVAALDRLWSQDLLVNSPGSVILNKEMVLSMIREGRIRFHSLQRRITRISLHRNCAVTMGSETVEQVAGAEAGSTVVWSFTHLWNFEQGEPKLIARHVSVMNRAPGAAPENEGPDLPR